MDILIEGEIKIKFIRFSVEKGVYIGEMANNIRQGYGKA